MPELIIGPLGTAIEDMQRLGVTVSVESIEPILSAPRPAIMEGTTPGGIHWTSLSHPERKRDA